MDDEPDVIARFAVAASRENLADLPTDLDLQNVESTGTSGTQFFFLRSMA